MVKLYRTTLAALLVLQFLFVLSALSEPAYAYVDPGSGLFALQVMSTTVAGVIFVIRRRLRMLFGKSEAKDDDVPTK
jgi:hypothetical protein